MFSGVYGPWSLRTFYCVAEREGEGTVLKQYSRSIGKPIRTYEKIQTCVRVGQPVLFSPA